MDWSIVIVGGLSFIGTLVGSLVGNSKTTALISYRIDQLEKKVEKHNSMVERTFKLESDLGTAFSKIDEIRDEVHQMKEGKG